MSVGTLWTTPDWAVGKGLRAIAAYGGVKIDAPSDYTHFDTNLKPEFKAKFPLGKIPSFEGKDGFNLSEATAIARYLASLAPNSTLLGTSPHESAVIDQWLSFASSEVLASSRTANSLVQGYLTPYHKGMHTASVEGQTRSFKVLEKHLQSHTFLVNERLTVADIFLAGTLQFAFQSTADASVRKQFPNVVRFFETVTNQPSVKEAFGETKYVEKAATYTGPKK